MVIETLSQAKDSLRKLLSNKKVLLVFDDMSSKSQLENKILNKSPSFDS